MTEVLGATLLDLGEEEEEVSGSAVTATRLSSKPTPGGGEPMGADGPGGRLQTRALYLLAPGRAVNKKCN